MQFNILPAIILVRSDIDHAPIPYTQVWKHRGYNHTTFVCDVCYIALTMIENCISFLPINKTIQNKATNIGVFRVQTTRCAEVEHEVY